MKKKAKKIRKSAKSKPGKTESKSSIRKNFGQYRRFQDRLVKKRDDILRIVKQKEGDITLGEIGDEADAASQTFEREMMFEMTNGERIILDDIEAALRKIEKGEFGICESCRKKITHERLHAMPWARYCIECQSRTEAPARV